MTSDNIYKVLLDIQREQLEQSKKISEIRELMFKMPCSVHKVRIKILETVVYGFVGIVLISFVAALPGIRKDKTTKTKNVNYVQVNKEQSKYLIDCRR